MEAKKVTKTEVTGVTLTMTVEEAKLLWQIANLNVMEVGNRTIVASLDPQKVQTLAENIYESLSAAVYYEPTI